MSLLPRIIAVLGILFLVTLIFWFGVLVGYHHGLVSTRWSDHYGEVWSGTGSPFMGGMMGGNIPSRNGADMMYASNGAVGKVVGINLPSIAVKNDNQAEKIVLVNSSTTIRRFHDVASSTEIHIGDTIVSIGYPDAQGRIQASFIRLIPAIQTNPAPTAK